MICAVSVHGPGAPRRASGFEQIRGGELAQRRDVEAEFGRGCDVERQPGDTNRPKDVSMREDEDVAAAGRATVREIDELLGSCVDLRRRLASGTSVVVDLPARPRGSNLGAGQTLVLAVVELSKQVGDLRVWETG